MSSAFSFNQSFDAEEDDFAPSAFSGRDGQIFVIDCSPSMFEDIEDEHDIEETSSLFIKCLNVLERFLLNKIINSHKDLVSLKSMIFND